ncbi:MAG TPA: ROK family protein [Verrucomicrobiae bacterium]|jgi:predicted NBD/HSP70 family sugar kinase
MKLKVPCSLDPDFQPAALHNRNYLHAAKASGKTTPLIIGLERENGFISRYETAVKSEVDLQTLQYVERLVKFLLWARGGWRLWIGGPHEIGEHIQRCYARFGERQFDANLMGRVYERLIEVVEVSPESVPAGYEKHAVLGGHWNGCRIGFDLGASDFKIAAVKEGKAIYSEEFPWNPKDQPDPQYHYSHLNAGLKKAAECLPCVDGIGGSSAGVIVDNKVMVSSLFRAVPKEKSDEAKNIFLRLQNEWDVPLETANDGDVTALAGAISLQMNAVLGIAMGSSEAAGYLSPQNGMTGWLSELAFAPVDYNPNAAIDEWSGDRGVGALYFSQQAVNKLLPAAKIELPGQMDLPNRLKEVQHLMAKGDRRAQMIYETIGVYLGYTIPHYADFYDFNHLLILGRVTTGAGGEIMLAKAHEVLRVEFPEVLERIKLHVPDEKSRRVGQAVAAASLPIVEVKKYEIASIHS